MQLTQQRLDEIFAAHQSGNFELLLKLSKQFQQDFPTNLLGYKAEGVALLSLGKISEALKVMKQAVKIDPYDDEAISNLGQTLLQNGKIDEAINEFENAKAINPCSAVIFGNLANAYFINHQQQQAEQLISKAYIFCKVLYKENVLLQQNIKAIFENIFAYNQQHKQQTLKKINHDSLHNKNLLGEIFYNYAIFWRKNGKSFLAKQCYEISVKHNPKLAQAFFNLAELCSNHGEAEIALNYMKKAMKLAPDDIFIQQQPLSLLAYSQNFTLQKINKEAKIFSEKVAKKYPQKFFHEKSKKFFKNLVEKNQKITLKIGLVSGDLRDHAVAKFLLNLFDALQQRQRLQINSVNLQFYAYPTNKREDSISKKIKNFCQQWTPIDEMSDQVAAETINNDGIQILFDLSGLTENHRLFMFALKPAPIQISWIGWLGTTGIPTMDYFLADEFCVPSGEKYEQQFSEKVLKMPHIWEVLTPPDFPREIQKNFCESRGNENENFIFASFNNPNKVNAKTLDLWSEVLKKSPQNTEFHWFRGDFKEQDLQEKFLAEFAKRGVDLSKIKLAATFGSQEYFEKLQSVDLILDTITATGMTTTAEALSVGTPTLTCVGDCIQNRFSGTCINAIGDENLSKNFIFDNENDFVNQAIFFAENPQKLNELKNGLSEKARKSSLCDAELFAKNFEIKMWEVWNNFLNS